MNFQIEVSSLPARKEGTTRGLRYVVTNPSGDDSGIFLFERKLLDGQLKEDVFIRICSLLDFHTFHYGSPLSPSNLFRVNTLTLTATTPDLLQQWKSDIEADIQDLVDQFNAWQELSGDRKIEVTALGYTEETIQ